MNPIPLISIGIDVKPVCNAADRWLACVDERKEAEAAHNAAKLRLEELPGRWAEIKARICSDDFSDALKSFLAVCAEVDGENGARNAGYDSEYLRLSRCGEIAKAESLIKPVAKMIGDSDMRAYNAGVRSVVGDVASIVGDAFKAERDAAQRLKDAVNAESAASAAFYDAVRKLHGDCLAVDGRIADIEKYQATVKPLALAEVERQKVELAARSRELGVE